MKRDDYWTLKAKDVGQEEYDCIYRDTEPKGFVMVSPPQMVNHYEPFTYNFEEQVKSPLKVIL